MKVKAKKGSEKDKDQEIKAAKDVNSILSVIQKKHGKESIKYWGSVVDLDAPVLSTGSYALNRALGVGGYPKKRTIEIFGKESTGKTTMALHAIAELQKNGGIAAFIDAEHALDQSLAEGVGVDLEKLLISQPDSGEQALDIVEMLATSGKVDLIVVDSVSALVPRAEIEGEMGDSHMGLQARLMSQAMRKLTSKMSQGNTCVIFINQIRQKIGVTWGSPETTSGGNALKFYSSIRLDIKRTGSIKKGEDIIGNQIRITVVKNKLAPPFKKVETELIFGQGINLEGEVLDLALEYGIVDKSGSWYSYKEDKIGQGRIAACEFLKKNRNILDEIWNATKLEGA